MNANRKLLAAGALVCVLASTGSDWPAFRGPTHDGTSSERGLPVKWSASENVVWKTKLPGPGTSSPIVWKDRLYLTCWTGHGARKGAGKIETMRRHLLCVDRTSGKILWDSPVAPKLPENDYTYQLIQHGYTSSTPATDGERVYVFFGRTGVLAFDLDGKQLWQTEVGDGLNSWGSASSPVLYKDLVIVNASVESGALVALDKKTGKQVWRVKGIRDCWSTPVLVEVPGGKTELVFNVPTTVLGFDPQTGEKLWTCSGISTITATSSPVPHKGVVYVMGSASGGGPLFLAVRAGGRGDVSKTHVLWTQKVGSNHTSPVLLDGRLYCVSGQVWCLKADTGAVVFQERLYDARQEYSSPVAVGDRIIAVTRKDGAYVLAGGDKLQVLARNNLGDSSSFNASPAVSDGRLYVRSDSYLYCIGKK
ncbi:MAG: PQQ-binding-like beta-propeller repeat protein [Gemmataceae bacterium]|nr:PQQ-binding-like beta-propeller repeat protein [Gemmataceae bacterium]